MAAAEEVDIKNHIGVHHPDYPGGVLIFNAGNRLRTKEENALRKHTLAEIDERVRATRPAVIGIRLRRSGRPTGTATGDQ